jgi:hypothetical protein
MAIWDVGNILKGAGALAGAWGTYKAMSEQNDIAKEQLAYQKMLDKKASDNQLMAQTNLDDALLEVYNTEEKKKKKNKDNNIDMSLAFDDSISVA